MAGMIIIMVTYLIKFFRVLLLQTAVVGKVSPDGGGAILLFYTHTLRVSDTNCGSSNALCLINS